MNFESAFLGPQSIQVSHLRSKTPLTSVDRLRGPPRRSNVDRIFANHPFPTLCSPRPFAGREEWATRRGARRPPLLRAPPRPWRCSPADPSPRPAPRAEVPWPPPPPTSRARARPGPPCAHGLPPRATRPCPTARAQLRLAAHLPWLPETRVGAAAGLLRGGPAMAARSGRARAGLPWSRRGGPGRPASAAPWASHPRAVRTTPPRRVCRGGPGIRGARPVASTSPRVQGRVGDPRRSPSRLHLRLARARPSRGHGRREQREARRRLLDAAVLRTSSAPLVPARGPARGGEEQRAKEGWRSSLLCASREGARPLRVPGSARHGAGAVVAPCSAPRELEREGEGGRREGEGEGGRERKREREGGGAAVAMAAP